MNIERCDLVDHIILSVNGSFLCDINFDCYNNVMTVLKVNNDNTDMLLSYKHLNYPTSGLKTLCLYLKHMLVSSKSLLKLGTGVTLYVNLSKCIHYNKFNDYLGFVLTLLKPVYKLEVINLNITYPVYIPSDYILTTLYEVKTGKSLEVPLGVIDIYNGSCVERERPESLKPYTGFLSRLLNKKKVDASLLHLEHYLSEIALFISFVKTETLSDCSTKESTVKSVLMDKMDYLLRSEIECSLINSMYGLTFKWDFIEKAYPTQFLNFLMHPTKYSFIESADSLCPSVLSTSILKKCKFVNTVGLDTTGYLKMTSYCVYDNMVIAKLDFSTRRQVSISKMCSGIFSEGIVNSLNSLYILDVHTRNILSSDGETKQYFIDKYKNSEEVLDYFKGVSW